MSNRRHYSPSRRRRGMIMVLVIWIVLVLTVIAYSLSYEIRISMKMTTQAQRRLKAQGLARAGLAHAVMDLRNDKLMGLADNGRMNDTLGDVWAHSEGRTDDKIDVKYGGGTYSVLIIDEDRKLNLNTLQPNAVPVLRYMLEKIGGMKPEYSERVAYAVIDFKDADLVPMGGQGGNEVDYYTDWGHKTFSSQLPADWVFRPKNDNFMKLSELLDIPGITPEILDGDPEKIPTDIFERVLSKRRREETGPLSDYLTVNSGGQINVNTCPVKLLEAVLAGITQNKENARWAEKIDRARHEALRKKTSEGFGINDLSQLVQAGIPSNVVDALRQLMGTGSSVFSIYSRGDYNGVQSTVQAMVWVNPEPYSIDPTENLDRKRDRQASPILQGQPNLVVDPAVRVISMSEF